MSNRATRKPKWLNVFDVASTRVNDTDTNDQMTLCELVQLEWEMHLIILKNYTPLPTIWR